MPSPERASRDQRSGLPIGRSPRYRRIRLGLLVTSIVFVLGPCVMNQAGVAVPRAVGFRSAMMLVLLISLTWWSFADEVLVSLLRKRRRVRTALRIALGGMLAAISFPMAQGLWRAEIPSLMSVSTVTASGVWMWHVSLLFLLPLVVALGYAVVAIVAAVRAIHRWSVRPDSAVSSTPALTPTPAPAPTSNFTQIQTPTSTPKPTPTREAGTISRRELLKAAGIYAPVILIGGATAVHGHQTGRFAINRYTLPAPWLPRRLSGLTITHVSDLHVGRLYRPEMLPRLIDGVNRLDSDIILVTGDTVDTSNDMLPPAMEAMKRFRHRHGLFLCIGNHDLIDNGTEFAGALRRGRFDLLIDERRTINVDGTRLTIAGLNWGRGQASHAPHVRATLDGYDPARDGPCIALAHHPHAFDDLADAGVPLTLAGHTHGGQLMIRAPRPDGRGDPSRDVGVGRILFRYLRGFYERGDSRLFVNSGVGNWFPMRLNAPAEIVQIKLV